MFSDREIARGYALELAAHQVPVIQCFLAEHAGADLHVIARAIEPDVSKYQPLLPWAEDDRWLFQPMAEA